MSLFEYDQEWNKVEWAELPTGSQQVPASDTVKQAAGQEDAQEGEYQFHWSEAQSVSGFEKSSKIILPNKLEYLREEDQCDPRLGQAASLLLREFGVACIGEGWSPELTHSVLITMRSIPQERPHSAEDLQAPNPRHTLEIVNDEHEGGFVSIAKVFDVFESWDADNSGKISTQEFQNVISDLMPEISKDEIDVMFTQADQDHDGMIDYEEFLAWMFSGVVHNEVKPDYRWQICKSCFDYAQPRLVRLDGQRGHFFSRKLHHALVNLVTKSGRDTKAANKILKERFAVEVFEDYQKTGQTTLGTGQYQVEELMANIQLATATYHSADGEEFHENQENFTFFHPKELVTIMNMFEEMPSGFHKIPGLRYLLRRRDGVPHPTAAPAPAVAWTTLGYIEFMDTAFTPGVPTWHMHRLVLHEKCHFMWEHLFSDSLKEQWCKIGDWQQDDTGKWFTSQTTQFVSAYAHNKNPDEDMAESVSYYVCNPDKLESRAPAKFAFIKDYIMNGDQYVAKVREDLTFQVLNLWPTYTYPGKICRVDISVKGAPEEDKRITVEIELQQEEDCPSLATHAYMRITSRVGTFSEHYFYPTNGEASGHILRTEFEINKNAAAGNWIPGSIEITDTKGYQRIEGTHDFGWRLFIVNPLEVLKGPVYKKGSAKMEVVEAQAVKGNRVQEIVVSYEVENAKRCQGVHCAAYASIVNPSSGQYRIEGYGEFLPGKNTAVVKLSMPDYMASGLYELRLLNTTDVAGNETRVEFGDNEEAMEPPVFVTLETAAPDLKPPEVDINVGRITITGRPTNPEAPNGETIVTIKYFARDPCSSGLSTVSAGLRDPSGTVHFNYHNHENAQTLFFEGGDPTEWKEYTWELVLPQGSVPGTWGLAEMNVKDKAGNQNRYNFVELVHFQVSD